MRAAVRALAVLAALALGTLSLIACLPQLVPAAPAWVTAVPGDGVAQVSWAKPGNGGSLITAYVVTPSIGGVEQSPRTFAPTATTQVLAGFANGDATTFTVTAVNQIGAGPASAPSPPIVIGTPAPPAFLVVDATADRQATIRWWPVEGVTGAEITPYLGTTPQPTQVFEGTGNHQTVTGLTNGATYRFQVSLRNAVGAGPSASTAAVVVGPLPRAPLDPSVVATNAAVVVSWTAAPDDGVPITGYVITPWIGSTALPAQSFDATTTTRTISDLTNGTSYRFVIQAVSVVGTGAGATTPTITAGLLPGIAAFPTAVAGNGSATVSWWAAKGNGSPITGYVVTPYIGSLAQAPQVFLSTATTEVVTGLTNGTPYTFGVAAMNIVGTGPSVRTAAVTPAGPPSAITTLAATAGVSSASVTWIAPAANGSPITGYVITPEIGGVAQTPQTFLSTATTQTVVGLVNGTTYTFRVAAFNAVGTGPPSPSSNGVRLGLPPTPGTPVAVAADSSAIVTWDSIDGGIPIMGYYVYWRGSNGDEGNYPYLPQPGPTQTQVVPPPEWHALTNGATYTFSVMVVCQLPDGTYYGSDYSPPSNPVVPTAAG